MFALTIGTFEEIRIQFSFFHFKSWEICLWVGFATPTEIVVIFRLVWPIALNVFSTLNSTQEC